MNGKQIIEMLAQATAFIRSKTDMIPEAGIVLGTGLGGLADEIDTEVVIPYAEIPGFSACTMEFHEGRLILGTLSGRNVIAMQGRFHLYEGFTMQEITFPVRVMHALGASVLFISNAAGGMNPAFQEGDLVLITDHINLLGDNPLIGSHVEELGPRFPDMSEPYATRLIELAWEIDRKQAIGLREGVYVAVPGPSLETRAEYRFLRGIGADMVGMSTVPENIVAVQCGMEVLGVTIVSDMCLPDDLQPADIGKIISTCKKAEPQLTLLVKEMVKQI